MGKPVSTDMGASRTSESIWDEVRAFAASWWYPWFVGLLSGINMFTIFLGTPLVGLYIAGAMSGSSPYRRVPLVAIANAVGTTIGAALVLYLITQNGTDWLTATFPSVFGSNQWERTSSMMQQHGWLGCIAVSAMPVVLHPLILFAHLTRVGSLELLSAILLGRFIKYCAMGALANSSSHWLRCFGRAAWDAAKNEKLTSKFE